MRSVSFVAVTRRSFGRVVKAPVLGTGLERGEGSTPSADSFLHLPPRASHGSAPPSYATVVPS